MSGGRLPELRDELALYPVDRLPTGEPAWVIHDPLRNLYIQLAAGDVALLPHLGRPASALTKDMRARIAPFLEFLVANQLVRQSNSRTASPNVGGNNSGSSDDGGWLSWLFHRYLFVKIPLIRPARALARTAHLTAPFYSMAFLVIVFGVGSLGLYLVSRQWESFLGTFPHFFSPAGVLWYGLVLVGIKVLHELGHAYTATRYRCHVASMGVTFLVLFPVLYTDTSDAWRRCTRRERIHIDLAGVAVELTLASFATFLWAFLPDGPARSAAFVVATTTWILSVGVNLNPFMRFDGYYLLSDLLGLPNLQPRAFALGRWALREALFKLNHPAPELLTRTRRRQLIAYAWLTWGYRFVLFVGIALLVYALFFKALGIALFVLELLWFIGRPVYKEIVVWWQMKSEIRASSRLRTVAVLMCTLVALGFVPIDTSLRVDGIVAAKQQSPIYVPEPAELVTIHIHQGEAVKEGEPLLTFRSPELVHALAQSEIREQLLETRLASQAADAATLDERLVLERELNAERSTQDGLQRRQAALSIRAPIAGVVLDLRASLAPGQTLAHDILLARVVSSMDNDFNGYISHDQVWRITPGSTDGTFISDNDRIASTNFLLTDVSPTASQRLRIPYVASEYGGSVATRVDEKQALTPTEPHYRIRMVPNDTLRPQLQATRGTMVLKGEAESFFARFTRRLLQVLSRESGL